MYFIIKIKASSKTNLKKEQDSSKYPYKINVDSFLHAVTGSASLLAASSKNFSPFFILANCSGLKDTEEHRMGS